MKSVLINKKIRVYSLSIVLMSVLLAGVFMQSCSNEYTLDETMNATIVSANDQKLVIKSNLSFNEVKDLKNRVSKGIKLKSPNDKIEYVDSLLWENAIECKEGGLYGFFVPLKNSKENDYRVLASLLIEGKMQEFIIRKIYTNDQLSSDNLIVYNMDGSVFRENIIKNINIPRLKSGPEINIYLFDDYTSWLYTNSSSQRFANNTNSVIWFKPETGGGAYPLMPGQWTDTPIDGFCYGSIVVKVCDGYNSCGVSGSTYNTWYTDPVDYTYNQMFGGPIGDAWLNQHQNGGWDDLFNSRVW
jgi:hypothetical protein